jgi:predicted nucleic acid-binding protein
MELVISDASCIIALEDIGELRILKGLFSQIVVTDIVRNEIQAELPDWIKVSKDYEERELKILELELDTGEASAIALALKNPGNRIILDERKGRSVAKRLGLKVIGTLGLIVKAKQKGIISSGKEVLNKLEDHGFWLSSQMKQGLLDKLGEK